MVTLPEDPAGLAATYQHVLSGKRALIVIDGVENKEALTMFLPPPNSALLATSRSKWKLPPRVTVINLDRFSTEEARRLLLQLVPWIKRESADEVCELCGNSPLAIRIVAGIISRKPELTPEQHVQILRGRIGETQVRPYNNLEAVLSLAYDGLAPDASRTFRCLAVFPSSFDALAEEVICTDPQNRNLQKLLEQHLIRADIPKGRYSLHPLARQFALKHLKAEEENRIARQHSRYYANLLSTTNSQYKQGTESADVALRVFDAEWINIRAGQSWAAVHLEQDLQALELCNNYPYAGRELLELRQHPRERIRWLKTALVAARILGDKKSESAHLSLMGIAHLSLGDLSQSVSLFQDALELAGSVGSKQLTSVALANLAGAYQRLGQLDRAENTLSQALRIAREIDDHRTEVSILNQLGDIHVNRGQFRIAIEFFERSLSTIREMGDSRLESSTLTGLGNAYSRLGELHRAAEYYEQSLALARKLKHKHGEAGALSNLGIIYQELGNIDESVAPLERALDIFREIGDVHGEAIVLGNLAISRAETGSYREAGDLFARMIEIVREAGNKAAEALALCNLAYVNSMLGENTNARALFEQALTILKDMGDRHGVARALSGIANTYANIGDIERAISYFEQARQIAGELGSRRSLAHILNNLGDVSIRDKRFDQAIAYLEQSLDIARETGAKRLEADALWHLGEANQHLQRIPVARKYAEEALAIYNQTNSPNSSKVQAALTRWANENSPPVLKT
jgi:tetratricopeptide (TPR) repeat protein